MASDEAAARPVTVPRLGQEMTQATLIRWLKADGATVRRGEPLYELDTDKVTQEVEAEADGVLRIVGSPGEDYAVGTTLAWIDEGGAGA
jgi:pyruvate/2-oxoglutarate dehydrogenase complex dihydrolipoamide acyltransferase (E2) component